MQRIEENFELFIRVHPDDTVMDAKLEEKRNVGLKRRKKKKKNSFSQLRKTAATTVSQK